MDNCTVKRVKKTKTCIGDKPHLVSIQTRDLTESDFESSQPDEDFTTVRSQWCALETIGFPNSGVARFAEINIEEGSTHIFWADYDSAFPSVENGNHYILYNDKRYKVLRVDNINELNETLAIQVTERGEDSEEATKA